MTDVEMLTTYNEVTQEEFETYEAISDLLMKDIDIPSKEIKECLSFYILKSYLLENKLI